MRMRRAWYRALLRRRLMVSILLLLQVAFLVFIFTSENDISEILDMIIRILACVIVVYVISKKDKGANKVTWVFLLLLFPVFGSLMYLLYNYQASTRGFKRKIDEIEKENRRLYHLAGDSYNLMSQTMPEHLSQVRYLKEFMGFPVYDATQTIYLSPGENFFPVLLEELQKAKEYIFMEYFIVEEGVMWNTILAILKEKARQGVEVRIIYDDIGCFLTLPKDYAKQLERYGIKCSVFNPFRPVLSAVQNNRNHQKITSIDGKIAFTGGLNLADEYINAYEKHGYWKDSAVMVKGKAAWSLTLIFLEMWELCCEAENVEVFFPADDNDLPDTDGFVQPFSDSPMDGEHVGEHVYLQIINNAKHYVYITTPYLIVDDSMISALCLAAKSGVDVRIITPHIWDKTLVHLTTRSYYRELIRNGVQIYEFTDGFIHSKNFVSDDDTAIVGTMNLDFRSLYLHFECGVMMYGCSAVQELKEDFLSTLEQCQKISKEDCHGNLVTRLFQDFLRIFAPLM